MNCPYCKDTMKEGTLNWYSGNMSWLPKGVKPPAREGDYVEGEIRLESSYSGLRPNIDAAWCPKCRKVIIDT